MIGSARYRPPLGAEAEMTPGTWRDALASLADGRVVDALILVEAQGYRAQAAQLRLEAARELAARGESAYARKVIAPAVAFGREIRASYWLAEADGLDQEVTIGGESESAQQLIDQHPGQR